MTLTKKAVIFGVVFSVVTSPLFASADFGVSVKSKSEIRTGVGEVEVEVETGAESENFRNDDSDDDGVLEIEVEAGVASPRDAASGRASGKRTYEPVMTNGDEGTTTATEMEASVSVRGWDMTEKKEIVVRAIERSSKGEEENEDARVMTVAASEVQIDSVEGLQILAESIAESDSSVRLVKIIPDAAEIDYAYEGRLLGIIPIRPVLKASVDANGSVKVEFPWYEFLVRRTAPVTEEEIKTEAESELAALEADHGLEAQAKAVVALSNVLKVKHETAMNSVRNVK